MTSYAIDIIDPESPIGKRILVFYAFGRMKH